MLRPIADNNARVEIYSAGNYDCIAIKVLSRRGNYALHLAVFDYDFFDFRLYHIEPVGGLQSLLHTKVIHSFVGLTSKTVHRRTFAEVEHTQLEKIVVGVDAHLSAESVDFSHEMTFGGSAYIRVARHKRYAVHRQRKK